MPQIHRAGKHSVGLVSLNNMDNQPAETFEEYSTENPGARQRDVRLGICYGTPSGIRTVQESHGKLRLQTRT
jgi:hypothetical protein